MSYAKPRPRPGLVCFHVEWNRDGSIARAQYRKPDRNPDPSEPAPAIRRSIVTLERPVAAPQGNLL